MEARFLRNLPALTEAECLLLRRKRVAVMGCGGLGGHLIELLSRAGVGAIRVVDGDVFDASNLNRQLLALPATLGQGKAEAAAARIRAIDAGIQAEAFPVFLDEQNAAELLAGCDAALDALDAIPARRVLARACEAAGIPWIHGAVSGWVAQAAVSFPGDGLIERLYPEDAAPADQGVLSFTPALCASLQAALCVKLLTGRTVQSGTFYYFDLLHQEFETIPLGPSHRSEGSACI